MNKVFVFIGIFLILTPAMASNLDGYKDYKFGQTEEEVLKLFPNASVEENCFIQAGHTNRCVILKDQNLFDYTGTITFRFHKDHKRVSAIKFQVKHLEGVSFCKKVLENISQQIPSVFPGFDKEETVFDKYNGALFKNSKGQNITLNATSINQKCLFNLGLNDVW